MNEITPKSPPRQENQQGRVLEAGREAAVFKDKLKEQGFSKDRLQRYSCGALALLLFLSRSNRAVSDVTAADWVSFREETMAGGRTAKEVLKGARAYLRLCAREGTIGEHQVPPGIEPHPLERLCEEGRRELCAFKARARTRSTVVAYGRGVAELLLFLERSGKTARTVTADDFRAFEGEILSRVEQGELQGWAADLIENGARYYLREKANAGLLRDEALLGLIAPRNPDAVRAAYVAADPREAAVFRELDAFLAKRRAAGYADDTRAGALALLRFLLRRRPIAEITQEDFESFRDEVRGDHKTLTGAWTYLRTAAQEGVIREDQIPVRIHARNANAGRPKPAPSLPEGLAPLPGLLEEGMAASDLSPTTRPPYRRAFRDFLVWLEGKGIVSLTDITRGVVTAYRLHLQAKPSIKGTPYAITTQLGALTALRFFFVWLLRTGKLLADPMAHLPNPRPPQKLPRSLKVAEVRRLILSLPKTVLGLRDRAMVELFYGTGMRRAELARLRVDDIDLEGGTALIREGKGRKDRIVPLGRKVQEALLDYLERARGKLLRGKEGSLFLFLGLGGRPMNVNHVSGRVFRLGARIGLKVRPHALRHSCATHLLKGKADIRHIQRLLGHKSLQTTERYTKVEVADLKAVIERCHPREKQA